MSTRRVRKLDDRCASWEGKLLAFCTSFFPASSGPAEVIRDLLAIREPEEGEEKFIADMHSVIFTMLAGLVAMIGICIVEAAAAPLSTEPPVATGIIWVAPSAFLVTLGLAVQVAKFRRRHDGMQPLLGSGSWVVCALVTLLASAYLLY